MPVLRDISDHPIALDLRVSIGEGARLRADAAMYSLWPDDPFGASADAGVWPSLFVDAGQAVVGRIVLDAGDLPFWQAFRLWDDWQTLIRHARTSPLGGHLIALALDRDPAIELRDDYALGQLAAGHLCVQSLGQEAAFMGYDIVDEDLRSALFDSARPDLDASEVVRTEYGLVQTRDAARALRDVLALDDPAHAPLSCVSVWSLGMIPSAAVE